MKDKIIIDSLDCTNCPEKARCNEQKERKNEIIETYFENIKNTANAYGCDLSKVLKELNSVIPNLTRCDIVLEKQLARKTKIIEALKKAVILKENNRYIQTCLLVSKTEECENERQLKEMYHTYYKAKHDDVKDEFFKLREQLQAERKKVKELEEKYKWYDHYKNSALCNKDLCNKKSDEIQSYRQALEEIKKIANVNAVNTCWTALNTCSDCKTNKECDNQSPFVKLKQILNICEVLDAKHN